MKKTILAFAALVVCATSIIAQTEQTTTESRKKEFGLRISSINFDGLNTFDLVYKKQKKNNENKYCRYRLVIANISSPDLFADYGNYNYQIGAAFGIEKRKKLNDKLKFIHGPELFFDYSGQHNETAVTVSDNNAFRLSFGYVIGVNYDINEHFCMSLETIPAIQNTTSFNYTSTVTVSETYTQSSRFNLGFNSKAAVTVCYKF